MDFGKSAVNFDRETDDVEDVEATDSVSETSPGALRLCNDANRRNRGWGTGLGRFKTTVS